MITWEQTYMSSSYMSGVPHLHTAKGRVLQANHCPCLLERRPKQHKHACIGTLWFSVYEHLGQRVHAKCVYLTELTKKAIPSTVIWRLLFLNMLFTEGLFFIRTVVSFVLITYKEMFLFLPIHYWLLLWSSAVITGDVCARMVHYSTH